VKRRGGKPWRRFDAFTLDAGKGEIMKKARVSHKNPCTVCGQPGIPGQRRGHGKCLEHYVSCACRDTTLVVYCRSPSNGDVRELNRFPHVGELTGKEMLERYGIRDHLKAVVITPGENDWLLQDFPPQ
jgi:hypothetical protein